MTDEIQELKNKIATLEKELEEAKAKQSDDDFTEIKEKYEDIIAEKDKTIKELNKTVETTKQKVNTKVDELNDEITEKLEQNEKYKELLATVEKLEKDKAEATVDTFIQQGKILPAQRETALKLCLSDNDTFLNLYKDAQPVVETQQKRSIPTGTAQRIVDYLKN